MKKKAIFLNSLYLLNPYYQLDLIFYSDTVVSLLPTPDTKIKYKKNSSFLKVLLFYLQFILVNIKYIHRCDFHHNEN